MEKPKRKSGMISLEVALILLLGLVAMFVAIGIFADNTKTMITSSNFQNILQQDNTAKTHFDTYNRNYSDNQVEVK